MSFVVINRSYEVVRRGEGTVRVWWEVDVGADAGRK